MSQTQLVERLKQLPLAEHLALLQTVLQSVQDELGPRDSRRQHPVSRTSHDTLLAAGAAIMLEDYLTDRELTAFSVLDTEDFHSLATHAGSTSYRC